jgi:hypothetical protein
MRRSSVGSSIPFFSKCFDPEPVVETGDVGFFSGRRAWMVNDALFNCRLICCLGALKMDLGVFLDDSEEACENSPIGIFPYEFGALSSSGLNSKAKKRVSTVTSITGSTLCL